MLSQAVAMALSIPYEKGQQRVAAILVDRKGRVIARAVNSYNKTHPLQKQWATEAEANEHKASIHAEIGCLIKSLRSKSIPHKIYVARVGKNGQQLPSFPCKTCQHALRKMGVVEIENT